MNNILPNEKDSVPNFVSAKRRSKSLVNYHWILKNVPFFLFLAALAVIYIANGHWADRTIRDINTTAKELKEMQYEYKTLKSEIMFKSRETEIVKSATPLGLKISNSATMRIKSENSTQQIKTNWK